MTKTTSHFQGMSLYSSIGERKYLTAEERRRFLAALSVLPDPVERSFCEMIHWSGCRPSEALSLHAHQIDLKQRVVVIRSLKKRGDLKGRHFRSVPLPAEFVRRLDAVHGLREAQAETDGGSAIKLWNFGRTTGWRIMRTVMDEAGLSGVKSTARGLRHALGVHAAVKHIPESRLQSWLGHASRETTAIYIDATGPEDRAIAARMWR